MDVKVYSTPTCPWCRRAKEFLKKNNIPYAEVNIEGNQDAAKEMMKKSSQMGVPVIEVDGQVIVGYDEAALKAALKI